MNTHEETPSWQVKSVAKAIQILSCFTPNQPELSLVEISRKLDIPKSTALNLLRTLEAYGYISRVHPSMNYRLGHTIMQLNYCKIMSMPVIRFALPFLEDLQAKTGKTIYLTTHVNGKMLYLDVAYQNGRMYSYSISGKTLHMHCTGCGKSILAYLPEQEVENILSTHGLPVFTPNTISKKETLYQELAEIRRNGYSLDHEEETLGVRCIAAPIRNAQGYPTAAISISGSAPSMQDEQMREYATMLIDTCQALSGNANEFPAGQFLLLNQK